MITLDVLKARVGKDAWESARLEAWRSAPQTGSIERWERAADENMEPFESVRDALDQSTSEADSAAALVALYTGIYRELPSYGILFDLFHKCPYERMVPQARESLWSFVREMLSAEEDALAEPVSYSMWCGFFEDPSTVDEAWSMLVSDESSPRLLRRILPASGPVPFPLKNALYDRLIGDRSWHDDIFRSLLFSATDVFGDFDREAARGVYLKLTLGAIEEADIQVLEAALAGASR